MQFIKISPCCYSFTEFFKILNPISEKKKRKLLFPDNFYKNSLKIPNEYSEVVNLKRTDNTMTKEQTTNPTKTLYKVCFHIVISYTRWRVQYRTSNNL